AARGDRHRSLVPDRPQRRRAYRRRGSRAAGRRPGGAEAPEPGHGERNLGRARRGALHAPRAARRRLSTDPCPGASGRMRGHLKPIRVGFVGAGTIAAVHRDAVTRFPGAVLVGITDRDPARARDFAARAHGVRAFPDLASMVDAAIDVVHVLTPPHTHAPVAMEALERGCHVLVEKPLATTAAACIRLAT